jgi:hypothetical protein
MRGQFRDHNDSCALNHGGHNTDLRCLDRDGCLDSDCCLETKRSYEPEAQTVPSPPSASDSASAA